MQKSDIRERPPVGTINLYWSTQPHILINCDLAVSSSNLFSVSLGLDAWGTKLIFTTVNRTDSSQDINKAFSGF